MPVLPLQLRLQQSFIQDVPGSVWDPLDEVPVLQMTGLHDLTSGGTHSCLGN